MQLVQSAARQGERVAVNSPSRSGGFVQWD